MNDSDLQRLEVGTWRRGRSGNGAASSAAPGRHHGDHTYNISASSVGACTTETNVLVPLHYIDEEAARLRINRCRSREVEIRRCARSISPIGKRFEPFSAWRKLYARPAPQHIALAGKPSLLMRYCATGGHPDNRPQAVWLTSVIRMPAQLCFSSSSTMHLRLWAIILRAIAAIDDSDPSRRSAD